MRLFWYWTCAGAHSDQDNRRCVVNAENLSAQEASAQQGAWLPQENVYEEWPQGAGSPSCEGPQAVDPVIFAHSARERIPNRAAHFRAALFCTVRQCRLFWPAARQTGAHGNFFSGRGRQAAQRAARTFPDLARRELAIGHRPLPFPSRFYLFGAKP